MLPPKIQFQQRTGLSWCGLSPPFGCQLPYLPTSAEDRWTLWHVSSKHPVGLSCPDSSCPSVLSYSRPWPAPTYPSQVLPAMLHLELNAISFPTPRIWCCPLTLWPDTESSLCHALANVIEWLKKKERKKHINNKGVKMLPRDMKSFHCL